MNTVGMDKNIAQAFIELQKEISNLKKTVKQNNNLEDISKIIAQNDDIIQKKDNKITHRSIEQLITDLVTKTISPLITNKIIPPVDSTSAIQITKADGTTNIVNIDSTNMRVGIGTSSPVGELNIKRNDASSLAELRLDQAGSGDSCLLIALTGVASYMIGVDRSDSNKFKIDSGSAGVGSATLLSISSSGNVLINTIDDDGTPAIAKLIVKASTADGSTNCFVGRDSDEANVFIVDSDGNVSGNHHRALTSEYRRYYHIPLGSANPGGSGATWVEAGANLTGGWRLTNVAHVIRGGADIHADWDGATDLKVEIKFAVNVNNTGGLVTDTVDLQLICYYKGNAETVTKSQTIENSVVVGQSPQYKQFITTFTIDWDAASNVVEAGDVISFYLHLETDTSEVDDIVITQGAFYYQTTHVGIESGDI